MKLTTVAPVKRKNSSLPINNKSVLLPFARWLLRWMLPACLCLLPGWGTAQSTAFVPTEIQFAGVSVFLTAPAQQRVQQEMTRLYADRVALRTAIEQMRNIDSVLEPMLEEHGIPSDFRYGCLPFRPNGGYWGLDATKASQLRLRVDNVVDERLNLSSATEATLAELAALFPKRTNWVRTLISFLQGQRPTVAADLPADLANATSNSLQPGLDSPEAIWTVLARKLVYEREAPLIRPTDQYLLFDYRQGRGKSLSAIADELNIDQARFVPFNEWLKARLIPTDKAYPVLIRLTPTEYITVKGQVSAVVQPASSSQTVRRDMGFPMVRRLPVSAANDPLTRSSAIFYEINGRRGVQAQSCDNLITLSYYGRLPVGRFIEINDLSERDLVRAGELYYLEPKDRRAKVPFHVVQPGQTLRDISNMYGVQLRSLLRFNGIEPNQRVQTGRIIWMQQKRPKHQPVEYQKLPDRQPDPEPVLTQRTVTKEDEDPTSDVPAAPEWRVINPDSVQQPTAMRMGVPSTPPPDVQPENVPTLPPTSPANAAAATTVRDGLLLHTVKAGDTHAGVAQRYSLRLSDLITWNNLSYRKPLVVGAQLIVGKPGTSSAANRSDNVSPTRLPTAPPTPAASPSASVPASTPAPRPVGPFIANSTRPAPDMKKTRGDEDLIIDVEPIFPATKGSTIRVQSAQGVVNKVQIEQPKVGGNAYYHVVKPGQTVYRVALINKVTVADVMKWNNLRTFSIEIGQRLLIKK